MKILILSQYPWQKENSFGNTYSSIFGKVEGIDIAHIYLMEGLPDEEPNISCYYQIPESKVIRSVFKSSKNVKRVGNRITPIDSSSLPNEKNEASKEPSKQSFYSKILSFGKRHHWKSMFYARELAWKYGKIDYDGLLAFVKEFKPDIFFLPYNHIYYTNRLAMFIKEHIDIPMVLELSMDHYSLKRVSWSPIFWIDRFAKRSMIRKLVAKSEMMYVISKKLKEECEAQLHIPCKILYKTPDENRIHQPYLHKEGEPVRFLFTGNIYANRWKPLGMLAKILQQENFGRLDIYTATPITNKMSKALDIEGVSAIHAPVSQKEVIDLQNAADVLVHTESFDKKNKLLVRCAISTKIMDYLSVGRSILAIGPRDISSIEYLEDNQVALVADNEESLRKIVQSIKNDSKVLTDYASRSIKYVSEHLNAKEKREALYNDLQAIIDNYKKKD